MRKTRHRIPRHSFCFALMLLSLLFSMVNGADTPFGPDFTINSFHAEITILRNSTILVEETIEIELREPVEAIWREIPASFINKQGEQVGVYISVKDLLVDSQVPRDAVVDRLGGMVRIRLPIDTGAWGKYRFQLKYTIDNAVMFASENDQFAWDIVGKNWRAEILKAETTVRFEPGVTPQHVEIDCNTGSLGYRTGDCFAVLVGGTVEVSSTRALGRFEGLNIDISIPKGILTPPTIWQRLIWHYNLRSNWLIALPLASLLFMIWRWMRKHRLLRSLKIGNNVSEVPSLDGPRLSPADLGVIYSERFGEHDIAATFFDLGTRGLLKLQEKVEPLFRDFIICPEVNNSHSLAGYERLLVDMSHEVPNGQQPLMSILGDLLITKIDLLRSAIEASLVQRGYLHTPPADFRKRAFIVAVSIAGITLALGFFFTELHLALIIPIAIFSGIPIALIGYFDTVKTERGFQTYHAILGLKNYISGSHSSAAAPERSAGEFVRLLPIAVALDVISVWASRNRNIEFEIPGWYVPETASGSTTVTSKFFQGVAHSVMLRLVQISPSMADEELDLDEIELAIAESATRSGGKRKHSRYNRR